MADTTKTEYVLAAKAIFGTDIAFEKLGKKDLAILIDRVRRMTNMMEADGNESHPTNGSK